LSNKPKLPTFHGRSLGITALTGAQLLIGGIHIFSGALLLVFENFSALSATAAYDVYTIFFGLLTLIFAVFIWRGKKAGWIGTIAVCIFVIAADSLTVLDLPSVPGIPKLPAATEIAYSLIVIVYLLRPNIRKKFLD
jgi:uncharacterized membrane protein (DUF2068 family)